MRQRRNADKSKQRRRVTERIRAATAQRRTNPCGNDITPDEPIRQRCNAGRTHEATTEHSGPIRRFEQTVVMW
jgi:hypothetical protein